MKEDAAMPERDPTRDLERLGEPMRDRHRHVEMSTPRVRTWRALIASLSELAFRDLDRPANLNDER
jgi:hypothetical protein